MALAEEIPRILHAGSGTRGPFSLAVDGVPITYASGGDIVITRFAASGAPTAQVEGVHYTLSDDAVLPDVGELVQTVTAGTFTLEASVAVLSVGEYILAERATSPSQSLVLTTGGGFNSASGERTFDAIIRLVQELYTRSRRSVIASDLDPDGALALPFRLARANKLFGWDADGLPSAVAMPEDGAQGPQGIQGIQGETGNPGASGDGSGDVVGPATNTADTVPVWNGTNSKVLKNATPAQGRTALGLGSAALLASSAVFQVANNLNEGNASAMRSNLGLGSAALLASSAVLQTANNLSDLASAATARTSLGLGSSALLAVTTTAQFLANTASKVLTTDQVNAAGAFVALTDAGTVAINGAAGINFSLDIGGNRTLGAMTNPIVGRSGSIYVTQDPTGGRTLAYHANYKWAGGVPPALSTPGGSVDRISYLIRTSTFIELTIAKGVA